MTPEYVIELLGRTMENTMILAAPLLAAGLIVGVIVALIQAITQVQEASLTFVPKALVIGLLMLYLAPWFVERVTGFTTTLAGEMSEVGRKK